MGHKKLIKFEAIKTFNNVLQHPENMQNNWKNHFHNEHPITLELACGKGEYTVGLARLYAERNFIGVDIKGNRIWKGAKTALDEGLNNVAFLRTNIDSIENYFGANEVDEIWITFPDPQLRWSHLRKRLTHPKFLRKYQQFLKADGIVHLKTDSPLLYTFTMKVIELYQLPLIESCDNVYQQPVVSDELKIKTYYESLDIAGQNRIHYIKFQINRELPTELDAELKILMKDIDIDV